MLGGLRRNGITEGVGGDVVEDDGEAFLDLLTHDVLPAAGLLVDKATVHTDDVQQQPFGKPMLTDHLGGPPAALISELEGAVVSDLDEAVALHARHRL